MARIRYLALLCPEPATLGRFYQAHFGLDELGRSADGDVTLTDGGYNLTLFKNRAALHEPSMENGIHHLGVAVDDVDAGTGAHQRECDRRAGRPTSNDEHVRILHPRTLSRE